MASTNDMLKKMASKVKVKQSFEDDERSDVGDAEINLKEMPIVDIPVPTLSMGEMLKNCLSNKKDDPKLR